MYGFTSREVADVIGVTEAAVTNHVHRGITRLHEVLAGTRRRAMTDDLERRLADAAPTLDATIDTYAAGAGHGRGGARPSAKRHVPRRALLGVLSVGRRGGGGRSGRRAPGPPAA